VDYTFIHKVLKTFFIEHFSLDIQVVDGCVIRAGSSIQKKVHNCMPDIGLVGHSTDRVPS